MILIVDDKDENLFSLKTLLQLHLYEVSTAHSGEEALKKILKNEFELIILDVQMPGMDGYEVAETITGYSRSKDIPIIFLSAVNIDKRFVTKGYASGAVDYLTKPFDPDILLLKVKTFTRLYRQTRELNEIKETLEQKVEDKTRALSETNKKLELSNSELQQYAFVASHDFAQEPLRKIITFSGMITDRFLGDIPEALPYMDKVIGASERMRKLIYDLLNYSKLSMVMEFTSYDLNKILEESVSDLEISIAEKEVKLEIGKLPTIDVLPDQMRQVFQNLLSNAIKFSKAGVCPLISVRAELTNEKSFSSPVKTGGDYCRIFITDNGIGFNERYLDKIFTMFQRLHGKDQYEGTGIGLSIVKKIIEKHNGLLTAKSKEDEGTTFILVLPVNQTAQVQEPAMQL